MKLRFWQTADSSELEALKLERKKVRQQIKDAEADLKRINRADGRREVVHGHTFESPERLKAQMNGYRAAVAKVERLRIEIIRLDSAINIAKHGN